MQTLFPKITVFPATLLSKAIRYGNYLSSSCVRSPYCHSYEQPSKVHDSDWSIEYPIQSLWYFTHTLPTLHDRTFSFRSFSCYNHVFTTDEYCCITRAFRSIRINLCTLISPVDDWDEKFVLFARHSTTITMIRSHWISKITSVSARTRSMLMHQSSD